MHATVLRSLESFNLDDFFHLIDVLIAVRAVVYTRLAIQGIL